MGDIYLGEEPLCREGENMPGKEMRLKEFGIVV